MSIFAWHISARSVCHLIGLPDELRKKNSQKVIREFLKKFLSSIKQNENLTRIQQFSLTQGIGLPTRNNRLSFRAIYILIQEFFCFSHKYIFSLFNAAKYNTAGRCMLHHTPTTKWTVLASRQLLTNKCSVHWALAEKSVHS